MLFDAHTRSFAAFGGIPRRGIYDNMKTAVDRVQRGKTRVVNARFLAMCGHYLFEPDFCNVASGWEKGIVEKNVQDRRRQVWARLKEAVGKDEVLETQLKELMKPAKKSDELRRLERESARWDRQAAKRSAREKQARLEAPAKLEAQLDTLSAWPVISSSHS